ncbi:hypothetical protein MP638_003411 [Amoeboaphelidium occidentale]|nr:hypothetical protein MP638_003411 [Amoeboaphelidium occidentale]
MYHHEPKTLLHEPKEPRFSVMQSSAQPNTSEALRNESVGKEELKHELIKCFKCSEEVAEAFAAHALQCAVPEGQDSLDWYLNVAFEVDLGDRGIKALTGKLPPGVSTTPTRMPISSLVTNYYGPNCNKEIMAWSIDPKAAGFNARSVSEWCAAKFGKRVLYRGVTTPFVRNPHLAGDYHTSMGRFSRDILPTGLQNPNLNEFGPGVYCTDDFGYALASTDSMNGSAVLVFDWNNVVDLVPYRFYDTNLWAKFVKQHICAYDEDKEIEIGRAPTGLHLTYDYIEGRITKNYRKIKGCHEPEPSGHTQVAVIRNTHSILNERLVAVIYVSSSI